MSNILYDIKNDYFNNNSNNNNYTMIFFKDINDNDDSKIGYSTINININTDINDNINTDINDNINTDINDNINTDINDNINTDINDNINTDINDNINTDINDNINTDIKTYKMINIFNQIYIDIEDIEIIEDIQIKNIDASTQTNECFDINKLKIDILALQVKNANLEKNFTKVSNLLNSFTKIDTLNPKIDNIKKELIKLVNREVRLHRPFPFINF